MPSILHFAFLTAVAAATGLQETLRARNDLTTFTSLLDQFGLWDDFEKSSTAITVMAPNDAAYDKLVKMGLILGDWPADFTVPILRYHLLREQIESARIAEGNEPILIETALSLPNMTQPSPVKLFRKSGELQAESGLQLYAKVIESDIAFAGGVLNVLDASLVAPHNFTGTAWMNGLCKEFLRFMEETGLSSEIESLHDATLFIPSDEAWQSVEATLATMDLDQKRALLRSHAVGGRVAYQRDLGHRQTLAAVGGQALEVQVDEKGGISIGSAAVVRTDILWYNGVSHMIDKVMMAEQTNSTLPAIPLVDDDQRVLAATAAAMHGA